MTVLLVPSAPPPPALLLWKLALVLLLLLLLPLPVEGAACTKSCRHSMTAPSGTPKRHPEPPDSDDDDDKADDPADRVMTKSSNSARGKVALPHTLLLLLLLLPTIRLKLAPS
jgi:hypothetical protein